MAVVNPRLNKALVKFIKYFFSQFSKIGFLFHMYVEKFVVQNTYTITLHCSYLLCNLYSYRAKCDHCLQTAQPVYHLTMSDATLRNFCSYSCVMAFQSQFPKTPITINEREESATPVPTGVPKRTRKTANKANAEPGKKNLSNNSLSMKQLHLLAYQLVLYQNLFLLLLF